MKSVLVDFLVSSGIKPVSVVSYNHLGNNDGLNLDSAAQFRSKEISKSNVVDDMVASNGLMFEEGEKPDHTVVIKYVPYVGDSKRAMDEYTSEIFLGGKYHRHAYLRGPLLASPSSSTSSFSQSFATHFYQKGSGESSKASMLSSHCSASFSRHHWCQRECQSHALFPQRQAIVNIMRACVGLAPQNHILLEQRLQGAGATATTPAQVDVKADIAAVMTAPSTTGTAVH